MKRKSKLKRIDVLSFAKLQAVMMSFLGLLAGILYSFGGAIYDLFTTGLNIGSALALLALVGMPFIFLVFGFVIGLVEVFLYNLFSRRFGGIEINFEENSIT